MLEKSLEELREMFAEQCSRTERMVEKSIKALTKKDEKLANEVINVDEGACNQAEIDIEKKAAEIIARFSPRATEMRLIIAIMKANGDLERIGDQAVNISYEALFLIPRLQVKPLIDLPRMSEIVMEMIRLSLHAFLQERLEFAEKALEKDSLVDDFEVQIIRELITYMLGDPSTIERATKLIFITKNLERIGDLATNISEDVIYYLTGEDIRHPGLRNSKNEE